MTDTSPFAPFQPSPPTTPALPTEPAEKPARAKRRTKAEMAAEAGDVADIAQLPGKPAKKASLKSHAPKFDLQTTLAAAKMLSDDDFGLFERVVILFDEAGKPQRDRVLAAIGKVFS